MCVKSNFYSEFSRPQQKTEKKYLQKNLGVGKYRNQSIESCVIGTLKT